MKYSYQLKGLDCPNCSAKIEAAVGKLPYVSDSVMNLMKQTLIIEMDGDEKQALEDIKKIVKSYEPDVVVVEKETTGRKQWEHVHRRGKCGCGEQTDGCECHNHEEQPDSAMVKRMIFGGIIYAMGLLLGKVFDLSLVWKFAMFMTAYLILGYDILFAAFRNILRGKVFDEHFLMSISTICAFVIGEYPEAVAVMLFYQIGEFCQSKAVNNSRRSISGLMKIRPDRANLVKDDGIVSVLAEKVSLGDLIVVKPGERIPLDGVIVSGETSLDTKALTGESLPREVNQGDTVFSGSINLDGAITLRVQKTFEESTASKIIDMVENASARKAPTEHFISKFAAVYTPVVVFLAVALAILPPLFMDGNWAEWIHRACVFLVVSCPCAFVISIPLTFFGGIGAAAKRGILVKGGNYLEALNDVGTIVFDKTGTLSKGVFVVRQIIPAEGVSAEELLEKAAFAESFSKHPIAASLLRAYDKTIDSSKVTNVSEKPGYGIKAEIEGDTILAGNAKLMRTEGIDFRERDEIGTRIYVARNKQYLGCIIIADELKEDSQRAIAELKKLGIEKMVILTGDHEKIAAQAAKELGIDQYYAQLLPTEKVEKLEYLDANKTPGSKLAFVGDGINDAPVLARADIGIGMGSIGSDAAIEAADIVLMTDEPSRIADAILIAAKTKKIVMQNIVFALAVKIVFLILGAIGIAGMWEAVFGDVGVTLIAIANSLRASGDGEKWLW